MEVPSNVRARTRARAMTPILVVATTVLAGRAAQLQLVRRPTAAPDSLALIPRPTRGRILDARGTVLADNVPRWELDVIPARLRAQRGATARLAAALGVRERDLNLRFASHEQQTVRVRDYLDVAAADAIRRADVPGAWLTPVAMRRHPHGAITDLPIGVMRDVAPDDLPWPYGYRLGDRIGARGIERSWDFTLRGNSTLAPTHQGMTLVTHLDLRLQRAAWEALENTRGVVVAIDPRDGRVLAYATRNTADTTPSDGLSRSSDPVEPYDDTPLSSSSSSLSSRSSFPGAQAPDVAPLGRMTDPILVALAQRHGVFLDARSPTTRCRSERAHGAADDPSRDGAVDARCDRAVETRLRAARIDVETLLRRAGFGRPTGIDLRGESPGAILSQHPGAARTSGGTARAWAVYATPLQVAMAYGAIVNCGTVYQPRIVHEVRYADGSLESRTTPVVSERFELPTATSPRTLASLAQWADARRGARGDEGLPPWGAHGERDVVMGSRSTGVDWFVVLAPTDAPRVLVAVMTRGTASIPSPPRGTASIPSPPRDTESIPLPPRDTESIPSPPPAAEDVALDVVRAWSRVSSEFP